METSDSWITKTKLLNPIFDEWFTELEKSLEESELIPVEQTPCPHCDLYSS